MESGYLRDKYRAFNGRNVREGVFVDGGRQTPPMFFSRDLHSLYLSGLYYQQSVFLVCGGPSLNKLDLSRLKSRGVIVAAVNNAAAVMRPHLWITADHPGRFCDSIWLDPAILKFVPLSHMDSSIRVRNKDNELVVSDLVAADCPGFVGYRRNETFAPERWLIEDTFNWGCDPDVADPIGIRGYRSVILPALRILYVLGFRKVYLLGCDFSMVSGVSSYAFHEQASARHIAHNNALYSVLNKRLGMLAPHFDNAGFRVFNCTPDSSLQSFAFCAFEDALKAEVLETHEGAILGSLYSTPPECDVFSDSFVEHAADSGDVDIPQSSISVLSYVDDATFDTVAIALPELLAFARTNSFQRFVVLFDSKMDPSRQHRINEWARSGIDVYPTRVALQCDGVGGGWPHAVLRFVARMLAAEYCAVIPPGYSSLLLPRIMETIASYTAANEATVLALMGVDAPSRKTLSLLDEWGDGIGGLSCFCRVLSSKGDVDSQADSINGPVVINCSWSRILLDLAPRSLPIDSLETFAWYCATRRGDRIVCG